MNYIKEFQKNNGLKIDGLIGKNTLLKMKEVFKLPSDEATAHFIGQVDHETAGFKYDRENLNYSAEGLRKTFGKYFPTLEIAKSYERKPEKIANKVYADRMGNGPESSGDGWKYAGKGSLQLTGKNNYTSFARSVGELSIVTDPDSILPKYYWDVALFFFKKNNLFSLTDKVDYDSVRKLTKKINGGYNGLQHRYDSTIKYYNIIKKKKSRNPTIQKHERETNKSQVDSIENTGGGTTNSVPNIIVPKKPSGKGGDSSEDRVEKSGNSLGFFEKIIRWILSKISGGYADEKRA